MHNITLYDQLIVPAHLKPGEYVLGLRWDCETSAQVCVCACVCACVCVCVCGEGGGV